MVTFKPQRDVLRPRVWGSSSCFVDAYGCGSKPHPVPFWGWESHPKVVFFGGFLGGHQGTGVLTHGNIRTPLQSLLFYFRESRPRGILQTNAAVCMRPCALQRPYEGPFSMKKRPMTAATKTPLSSKL